MIPAQFITVQVYRVHQGPGSSYTDFPHDAAGLAQANALAAESGVQVVEAGNQVCMADAQP